MRAQAPATHGPFDAEINLIPMIDVLLVLIVIFMILQAELPIMKIMLPPEANDVQATATGTPQIVLQLLADGSYAINETPVRKEHLARRITELYLSRPVKVMFIQAAPQWRYQEVIDATDIAKGAGVQVIGFMPYAER